MRFRKKRPAKPIVQKKKETEKRLRRLRVIFFSTLYLGFIGLACLLVFLIYLSRNLPPLDDMINPVYELPTQVYDRNGNLITEFYTKRRILIPIDQVPDVVKQALLAIEDNRFYDHLGIDPIRIMGALLVDIKTGSLAQGGSTLTQQTAKLFKFSSEKKWIRKIQEALLALKMENVFTKDQILELYLTKTFFGHRSYGIEAASQKYFGKNTEELTLEEAACLVGIPQAPSIQNPISNMERSLARRNLVLRKMRDFGYISTEQMIQSQRTPIRLNLEERIEYNETSYYMEHVRQYIEKVYGEDKLNRGGLKVYTAMDVKMQVYAQTALNQGLIDHDKRQGYRGPVKNVLQEIDKDLGLLMFTEEDGWDQESYELLPETIKVTIRRMFDEKIKLNTEENHFVIGGTVLGVVTKVNRQSADVDLGDHQGQILLSDIRWARPVDYTERLSYKTRLNDIHDIMKIGDVIRLELLNFSYDTQEFTLALTQEPIANGAIFSMDPESGQVLAMSGGIDFNTSEFNRATQAKRQTGSTFKTFVYGLALDSSFTTASMLADTPITGGEGSEKWKPENFGGTYQGKISLRNALVESENIPSINLTIELGTETVIQQARKFGITGNLPNDPTIVLGTASLTLEEMVKAFGVFANGGRLIKPVFITKIVDRTGGILEETTETESEQIISKETAYLMTNILEDVVQRGTGRRAQAINRPSAGKTGTTDDSVDAWYIGYIPQMITGVFVGFDKNQQPLGDHEQGAVTALPIWVDYMKEATPTLPILPFTQPEGITMVPINADSGLRECEPTGNSIIEYFKTGTEPTECHHNYSVEQSFDTFDAAPVEESPGQSIPMDSFMEEL